MKKKKRITKAAVIHAKKILELHEEQKEEDYYTNKKSVRDVINPTIERKGREFRGRNKWIDEMERKRNPLHGSTPGGGRW